MELLRVAATALLKAMAVSRAMVSKVTASRLRDLRLDFKLDPKLDLKLDNNNL